MAGYILLSKGDRERLNAPERVSFELADITAREQAAFQVAFAWHTVADVFNAMKAMIVTDDDGVTRIYNEPKVMLALTWLALRQNNILTARRGDAVLNELLDLDIQLVHTNLDWDDPQEGDGGKDPSTPTETSES